MPDDPTLATTHLLDRTSPKGTDFIGTCRLCGARGLHMGQALEPCTNPQRLSSDEVIVAVLEEPPHGTSC